MRKSAGYSVLFLLVVVILCLGKAILAQTVSGSFRGTVNDISGASIPGAVVKVTNAATGVPRETTTDASGNYVVTDLPPGVYDFTVTYTGFATNETRGVPLLVDQVATLDFSLQPGNVKQEITISGQAPQVNFTNSTVGEVVGSQEVVQLPLNGRQFTQLILLTPGAAPQGSGQQGAFEWRTNIGAVSPAVNGMRSEMNDFTIDGVENNEFFFGFVAINPPPDAIQEFKVQTDMSSGEYGRGGGANVNVVTKGGTNDWHGDAWEFLRNTNLNARNFFNPKVSAFHQNQFGGTLGGPILKNKVWGFGWYEGFRKTLGSTSLGQVPTAAQLAGDLSAFEPIFNPFSTTQTGTDAKGNPIFTRQRFNNNLIPTNLLNPTAEAVAKALYPAPNYAGQSGINYLNTESGATSDNQVGARVDAALSSRTNIFGRFTWDKGDRMLPSTLPEGAVYTVGHDLQQVLGLTHVFNPTTVLDLHAQFLRTYLAREVTPPVSASFLASEGLTRDWPANTGLPPLFPSAGMSDITGLSATSISPAGAPINHFQYSGSLSKTTGNHTINAGVSLVRTWVLDNCTYASGNFNSVPTSDPQNPTTTGSGLASFLLGVPTSAERWAGSAIMTYQGSYWGAYLDDVWKATPKLTVTLGVRYDYASPFVETDGRASGLDFLKSTPTQTVWFIQRGAHPTLVDPSKSPMTIETVDSVYLPQRKDWAPRVGAAYRLGHNLAIRAGFGIFYDFGQAISLNTQEIMGQWPFGFSDDTPGDLNLPTAANPTPQHIYGVNVFPPFVPSLVPSSGIGNSVFRQQAYPYVEEWNLMLEKDLGHNWSISGGYLGSKGTHMVLSTYFNAAPPGPGPIAPRARLPQFDPFQVDPTFGNSSYQAFQLKVEKRFSRGLSLLASYAYSKSIDEMSAHFGTGQPGEGDVRPDNYRANRGVSDYDLPQNFVLNYVYSLPFGRSQRYVSNAPRVASFLVSGWQSTGILSLHSGFPFSIAAPYDVANSGAPTERPWLTAPLLPSGFQQTLAGWFNTNAFTLIPYTYGNMGRNIIRQDGVQNLNFGLFKQTKVAERLNTEFRVEAFNLFNTPTFLAPNTSMTSKSFGRVLSANDPRFLQFGFKVLF